MHSQKRSLGRAALDRVRLASFPASSQPFRHAADELPVDIFLNLCQDAFACIESLTLLESNAHGQSHAGNAD